VAEVGVAPTPAEPRIRPQSRVFQSLTIGAVRMMVARRAAEVGLDAARNRDLVLAVCELATNSVRHADGRGVLRIWQEGYELVCEVADRGRPDRPLHGRRRPVPGQDGGYGLWIAEQLCDRLEAVQTESGVAIRLYMRLQTT
jgi:anti-sigma regulatory factor (Ser/Thr protein kinase)